MQRSLLAITYIFCTALLTGAGQVHAQAPAFDTLAPQATKAVFHVPNAVQLKNNFQKTQLNAMLKDPVLQPFRDDLRKQVEGKFGGAAGQLGLTLKDFRQVASGEISSIAIQPLAGGVDGKPNPTAHCAMVLADVTGNVPAAQALVQKAVASMVAKGGEAKVYTIEDEKFSGVNVKSFAKVGNGFVFLAVVKNILIACDHYGETLRLMKRINGTADAADVTLAADADYQTCMQRIGKINNAAPDMRWFVEPFGYMEVNRASKLVRRGRGPDMLLVARKTGFEGITAIAGQASFATQNHEMLFHNYIYIKDGVANLKKSAAMLKTPPIANLDPEDWAANNLDSYTTASINADNAFESAKPLVNELAGAPVFEDVLTTLKEAANGPKVDIRKDIVANLDNRVTVVTSHTKPIKEDSERIIGAVKLTKPDAVAEAINKALTGDPDARKRQVGGQDYWEILGEREREGIDGPRIKAPFGPRQPRPAAPGNQKPATPNAAVTVMFGYLFIGETVDALVDLKTATAKHGKLAPAADYQRVLAELKMLGLKDAVGISFARSHQSLEAPYEMMKANKMPQSKSVFGRVLNLLLGTENEEGERKAQINGNLLPAYAQIEKYLGPSGSFIKNEPNGWVVTGCILKQNNQVAAAPQPAAPKEEAPKEEEPAAVKPAEAESATP